MKYLIVILLLTLAPTLKAQITSPQTPSFRIENPEHLKGQKRSVIMLAYSSEAWYLKEAFDANGHKNYHTQLRSWEYVSPRNITEFTRAENGNVLEEKILLESDTAKIYTYTYGMFDVETEKVGIEVYGEYKDTIFHEKLIWVKVNDSTTIVSKMAFEFSHQRYVRFPDPDHVDPGEPGKDEWVLREQQEITTGEGYVKVKTDAEIIQYFLNELDQVYKVIRWQDDKAENHSIALYEYENGRLTKETMTTYNEGVAGNVDKVSYTYNEHGNMTFLSATGGTKLEMTFSYDDQNRLISETEKHGSGYSSKITNTYE